MNRLLRLILVIVLLITCYGCFIPGRGLLVPGDHDGGGRGDHDGGGRGDHDRGGHGDKDRGKHR